jgi:hypothetical protein
MITIIINFQQSDIIINIEETNRFIDIQDILEQNTGIGLLDLYDIDLPDNIIDMEIQINQIYPDTIIINLIALLPYFELTDQLINNCRIIELQILDLILFKELAPKIPFERYIWTKVTNYNYLFMNNDRCINNTNELLIKKYQAEIESTFYLFDTSNGTSFIYTFFNSSYKLNGVMNWDLSKGINFRGMFSKSKKKGHNIIDDPINLNKLIIPNNEHVNLIHMFAFSKIESSISDWDISKVIYVKNMCYNSNIELPILLNKSLLFFNI